MIIRFAKLLKQKTDGVWLFFRTFAKKYVNNKPI